MCKMETVESHQFMSKSPQIICKNGRHMMGLNVQDRKMLSGLSSYRKSIFDSDENKIKKYITEKIAKCIRLKTVYLMFGSLLMSVQPLSGVATAAASNTNQADLQNSYVVNAGDTLTSISKKNKTTIKELKKLNNLTSDWIQIGQRLKIPKGSNYDSTNEMLESSTADIQNQLHLLGYNYVPAMTGNSDSATVQAIKAFQSDYGLSVTGKVDPTTEKSIEHAIVKKNIIEDTYRYLGVPYVWGGETPSGFDCSGFVYYMFNEHGINIPRETSGTLFTKGTTIDRSKLQPGDLVFFAVKKPGVVSHVGFYVGNNNYISATSTKGIEVYSVDSPYWGKYYYGAKRIF